MCDGFFSRGLPGRTGDADQRLAPEFSHGRGQRLQRDQGIVHGQEESLIGKTVELILVHDRRNRTFFESGFDEVVTVQALAFDGEEEFAFPDGARVDGIALRDVFGQIPDGRGSGAP